MDRIGPGVYVIPSPRDESKSYKYINRNGDIFSSTKPLDHFECERVSISKHGCTEYLCEQYGARNREFLERDKPEILGNWNDNSLDDYDKLIEAREYIRNHGWENWVEYRTTYLENISFISKIFQFIGNFFKSLIFWRN